MTTTTTTTTTIAARGLTAPAILDTAKVGDRVRSFDWKGSSDCVEGIVTEVADHGAGCFRYTIAVDTIWESEFPGGDATVRDYVNTKHNATRYVQPFNRRESDFVNLSK